MNTLTIRFALPAIVIVTIIALAMIAFAFATHAHIPGTAWIYPS
jgi:hypothetical protein